MPGHKEMQKGKKNTLQRQALLLEDRDKRLQAAKGQGHELYIPAGGNSKSCYRWHQPPGKLLGRCRLPRAPLRGRRLCGMIRIEPGMSLNCRSASLLRSSWSESGTATACKRSIASMAPSVKKLKAEIVTGRRRGYCGRNAGESVEHVGVRFDDLFVFLGNIGPVATSQSQLHIQGSQLPHAELRLRQPFPQLQLLSNADTNR